MATVHAGSLHGSPAEGGVTAFVGAVRAHLHDLIDTEAARCQLGEVGGLFAELRTALDGGKGLRPAFCHAGYVAAAGRSAGALDGDLVRAGAALELLHTFALIHDDVMDGSPLRRGRPSVHAALAATHREHGWRGEVRRVSEGMAVLVGDVAFTLAHRLAAEFRPAASRIWHRLCGDLMIGQYLDLHGSATGNPTVDHAAAVAVLKSAHYTVLGPLRLGYALSGSPTFPDGLSQYGLLLGEAFQLRDDLLGVFGDSAETGKPVGEDLRNGKPTRLLAIATERATGALEQRILKRVGDPELSDDDVDELVEVVESTGAQAEVEYLISQAVRRSVTALEDSALHPDAVPALTKLAYQTAWRSR
ncbi:polyprenyl synthetase family protein [Tenggerimyces flavus]|uniref:Polyprenyl synthetase family protein n=1 Tax=Tenggerimyces flavus TaxID=1708749 RepID=A0ABV7YAE5_9ACTN|nr:polyprenyl synthetase family protein [Tenggerimyces flavus]MBM7785916.1 geranylgeranyl diphosphate synthase type I [Tenggerimyces flavus]